MDEELVPVGDERRCGDRRTRRIYVFRDKRTGFDRREPACGGRGTGVLRAAVVSLRDNPGTLRVLLVAVNALNLTDFFLTLNALHVGAAEANPIMRSLFESSPVWAGIFKTASVLVASVLVWQFRRYRKALSVALLMLVLFAGVFVYHMFGLALFR
ncbi:MAG: hypothetical protein A2133_02860 [Actinobacteria bacterium RBG_16_64_13]|nr:MAG: hypothetical protein A2133_02860 [Actinobacteria bacterium RBG_16_64_13]